LAGQTDTADQVTFSSCCVQKIVGCLDGLDLIINK
jgi:hypothetical protein